MWRILHALAFNNESCSSVCGDGLFVLLEECDDSNNMSGDGCSECEVEDFYECVGEPSNCSLLGFITFSNIDKNGCNGFNIFFGNQQQS